VEVVLCAVASILEDVQGTAAVVICSCDDLSQCGVHWLYLAEQLFVEKWLPCLSYAALVLA
jgi:hypothetical protein